MSPKKIEFMNRVYFLLSLILSTKIVFAQQKYTGNVGINTDTPEKTLHIKGNMHFQDINIKNIDRLDDGEPFRYLIRDSGDLNKIIPYTEAFTKTVDPVETTYIDSTETGERTNHDDYYSNVNIGGVHSNSNYHMILLDVYINSTIDNAQDTYRGQNFGSNLIPWANCKLDNGRKRMIYDYPILNYPANGKRKKWTAHILTFENKEGFEIKTQEINMRGRNVENITVANPLVN